MALAQGHPVGQPLDMGSQAMQRRQPNWARRLAGHAQFAPTDLLQDVHRRGVRGTIVRVRPGEIIGSSTKMETWFGCSRFDHISASMRVGRPNKWVRRYSRCVATIHATH